jgi:hypothetical protein
MPLSDQFAYTSGDRVKHRRTNEEGRILNIQALAEGALLITVAIFVAGILSRKETFVSRAGQVTGLDWLIKGTVRPGGGSVTATQAQATARAAADEPVQRSMSSVIQTRLRSANLRRLEQDWGDDAESASNALYDRMQHLRRVQDAVFGKKDQHDLLMNYLTSTSRKSDTGEWFGNYLSEIIYNPKQASAVAIAQGNQLHKILQRTGIPVELGRKYRHLIPEGVETAYELLVHAKQQLKRLSYKEGSVLWNEYASILRRAVELSPRHQRLMLQASTVLDVQSEFRQLEQVVRTLPNTDFSRFGTAINPSEFSEAAPTHYQLLQRTFARPESLLAGREEGPKLDVREITRTQRRKDGIGARPGVRSRGSTPTVNAADLFATAGESRIGSIVQFNGLPWRIGSIDTKLRRVTLVPFSSDIPLRTTNIFERPGAAIEALKTIGRTGSTLPLAADVLAQKAGVEGGCRGHDPHQGRHLRDRR